MKEIPKRVLITGAGRSGTSALIKFARRYINENFLVSHYPAKMKDTNGEWAANTTREWNTTYNAGLEYVIDSNSNDIDIEKSPYIFKDPRLCITLKGLLKKNKIDVDHLFILIRNYRHSALSRQKRNLWWYQYKGLRCVSSEKTRLQNQIEFNERCIGKLMETVAEYDIPHTILHFPRFIEDKEYLFNKLQNTPLQISQEQIESAFDVFDKKQVNF